jgi:cytochrome oxidase Cu insertion factor (SCO1/SenC/PrrC family)
MKKNMFFIFVFSLGVAGCRKQTLPLADYGNIGDFKLTSVTTTNQGSVDKKALSGRVWIANFILTNCNGPCPFLSGNMEKLQSELPKEVGFLSFTVDPENDDAPSLQRYAKRFSADPGRWLFVRGDKASLYELYEKGWREDGSNRCRELGCEF